MHNLWCRVKQSSSPGRTWKLALDTLRDWPARVRRTEPLLLKSVARPRVLKNRARQSHMSSLWLCSNGALADWGAPVTSLTNRHLDRPSMTPARRTANWGLVPCCGVARKRTGAVVLVHRAGLYPWVCPYVSMHHGGHFYRLYRCVRRAVFLAVFLCHPAVFADAPACAGPCARPRHQLNLEADHPVCWAVPQAATYRRS